MTMQFSLALTAVLFGSSNGLSAYYSYQDATCIDSNTIKGTAVMSFDDSDYAEWGYSEAYYGGCFYFVGGSLDLESYDYGSDFYDYGYCVECDGAVGCSSDGTCDAFMTYPGTTASSGYQMTVSGSTEQKSLPFGHVASEIKTASLEAQEYKAVQNDDNASIAAVAGGVVGGVVLMSLVVVTRNWIKKKKLAPKIQLGEIEATSCGGTPTGHYILSKDIAGEGNIVV